MRNLTNILAVLSLLAPASGHTLGIGDIKLLSSLNQNLNAVISLVESSGEKASDIKVHLASPDKFDEAGVPWTPFLSKIKFTTVVSANGSVVIRLSSDVAVKEPFLDFLLEVSWPKGSLYREFTVLVDPPDAYKQTTIPIAARSESYEPEQGIFPVHPALKRQQTGTGKSSSGAREYGPTEKNDTLWKIAERAGRWDGVSVEQMMIALYEENPRAFYQENMNALLIGKILKIPDRKAALKFSRNQALAELNRQTKAWKHRLTKTPIETANVNKADASKKLTLLAPAEAAIPEKVEPAAVNEQINTIRTGLDKLPAPSETAGNEVDVATPVDDALQAKVADLEKQLATMQQIIASKDQQLAVMQKQLQAKPVNQEPVIQAAPGQVDIESAVAQPKPAKAVVKSTIKPESEAEGGRDSYYVWVAGIGMGTLTLLGWYWWRKHKLDQETEIQTPFDASNIYKSKGNSSPSRAKNSVAYDADGTGESSFLGEISSTDVDLFDTDQNEIDPVSEADVYLAYGRYQQAEELMRDALEDQPDRDDCKLKLLEIIYSRKDKHAFEAYVSELAETGKKDDIGFWAKVTQMGRDICPDSILFSSGVDRFAAEKKTTFEKNHATLAEPDGVEANRPVIGIKNADFIPVASNEPLDEEAVKETSETAGGLLNVNLTSFDDDVPDDEWKNNESIDFDSGGPTDNTELDKAHDDVLWKPRELAGKDEFEAFDFDLSEKADKEKELDKLVSSVVKGFDEGYHGIDFSTDNRAALSENISNDPLEDDFDFDISEEGQDSDLDELETKLDLAMAYIDMNDSDAARDIAREVLEKGTPEQQLTAQALLDRLK